MSAAPETARRVHLVAHFPGVNSTTVWSDPASGSHIDFESFRRFAQTAERGRFDYVFLAEGLRVREHGGRIHDLDVAGRPATLAILTAMASVTRSIGVVGTLSSTFNEPVELARQLATIDHLSSGRVGWNVVTSPDAFHGGNFRRGGFLPYAERYTRAEEFVELAKELWDSWEAGAILADRAAGRFVDPERVRRVVHRGPQFDVTATSTVPRSPQGYPVIVQAGDSPAGRDFAAANAEIIFSRHTGFADGQRFYRDVKGRLPAAGRTEESLLILPGATFALGDTDAEARERSREIALAQTSPQTAIAWVEAIWGRELPGLDPDGGLPAQEPGDGEQRQGQVSTRVEDRVARAEQLRDRARREGLTLRELVAAETAQHTLVGSPETVASEIDRYVLERASDGFVLVPHLTPGGLDEFVDRVVPLLQERGVFRTDYEADPVTGAAPTLRRTLGLPTPPRPRTEVRRVHVSDPLAKPLLDDLEREYDARYGVEVFGEPASTELARYPAEAFAEPHGGAFLVLLRDGEPISGGAFMRHSDDTAEFKRIWTRPDHRGRGVAKVVLTELEREAARLGYSRVYLTTGPRQPEAVALYLGHGYTPLFDPALPADEVGVHPFEKPLAPVGAAGATAQEAAA